MGKKIKGVIFDMDGLMFDTERLSSVLWKQAGRKFGIEIPEAFIDSFRGRNAAAIEEAFRNQYGEEFPYEECRDLKTALFEEYIKEHGVPEKKGLKELLEYLKESGIRMAVATSTGRRLAVMMLKSAGVYPYFHAVAFGDEVKRSKPCPDIFIRAAELLGLSTGECLVLEDSIAGVEAGKAFGGEIIHIPDVLEVPEDVKAGITAEMEDLAQVAEWLKSRTVGEEEKQRDV